MFKLKKKLIVDIMLYCIAIFLVVDINCVWVREYKLGDNFFTALCILFITIFLVANKIKLRYSDFLILFYILILVTFSVFFYSVGSSYIITVGIGFPLAIFFVRNIKSNDFEILSKISNVIYVFSIVSLFFYIFGSILDWLPNAEYTSFYWGGDRYVKSYYDLYFESQGSGQFFNDKILSRNCGFFCEAPMFGYLIALAFIIELFVSGHRNYLKIVILFVTGFTTTSSTCIAAMVIALMLFAINTSIENKSRVWLRIFLLLCIPGIVLMAIYVCYFLVQAKKNFGTESYNIRIDDISSCVKVFLKSPIFGAGVGNYQPIFNTINMQYRSSFGLSTCVFVLLAQTGISFIIWPIVRLIKNKYTISQYSFLAVLFLLLLFTNIPYKLINVILVYSILYRPVVSDDLKSSISNSVNNFI